MRPVGGIGEQCEGSWEAHAMLKPAMLKPFPLLVRGRGKVGKQLNQRASRTYAMLRLQHKLADESQDLGAVLGRRGRTSRKEAVWETR